MQELDAAVVAELDAVVTDPAGYVARWKSRTGRPAIATLPMNFPAELITASGALASIVPDDRVPVTAGRSLLAEFYCGYSRNLADQGALGRLDGYDGIVLADHCVQLLGAADIIRMIRPTVPLYFAQFTQSLDDPWAGPQVRGRVAALHREIEAIAGSVITPESLADAIRLHNEDRRMLRRLHELRRAGLVRVPARQLVTLVTSGMVMDVAEHVAVLTSLLASLEPSPQATEGTVAVHLSGHFCHAPRPEILDLIEECGARVVDDDLYTGYRFISTDVREAGDPFDALADWYANRNTTVPCPTRVQPSVDWDAALLSSVEASGAAGVIVLMAKFCEPHMLYYPELRATLEAAGVPVLLVETEHEGLPIEVLRTSLETYLERIRRRPAVQLV